MKSKSLQQLSSVGKTCLNEIRYEISDKHECRKILEIDAQKLKLIEVALKVLNYLTC